MRSGRLALTFVFLLGMPVLAQTSEVQFVQPVIKTIRGTVDVEVRVPVDTTAVRFAVDDARTSELTNEYAVATQTPVVWRTVISSNWFPAGMHALTATAVTPRGFVRGSISLLFENTSTQGTLNGAWRFASADTMPAGSMEGARPAVVEDNFDDSSWSTVLVPTSIDTTDARWMRHDGLLGTYRMNFQWASAKNEKQDVYLHEESCFWSCRFFVNGVEVGSSSGGYLPRRMLITQALHPGTNYVAIIVDSRAATMGTLNKLRYYYWNYTGLLQDIGIETLGSSAISEFRAQAAADGSLTIYPSTVNTTGKMQILPAVIRVRDNADGREVFMAKRKIEVSPDAAASVPIGLHVNHVALWDLDHPHLYTVEMEVRTAAGVQQLREQTGFRDIVVREGNLLLNGKPVLGLQGFDRHGDYPGLGKSQPDGLADREIKQLHDAGYRIFRPAHYPTTKAELDAADKYGMLVLEEINITGLTGEQLATRAVIDFAKDQLNRMIARDRSHPSIFAWSIGNENRTDQPGSPIYVHDVIAYGKSIDKDRPFTEVSAQLRHDICYSDMDFLAVNIYAGWYTEKIDDVVSELDALERYAPHKPIVITEYGAEAVPGRRGTGKGSEYFQALTVDAHNRLLKDRPNFIGKMYWTSSEFVVGPKWDGGNPDPVPPFHTKGLLDFYRRPKLAWRVMFSPADLTLAEPIKPKPLPFTENVHFELKNRTAQNLTGKLVVEAPQGSKATTPEQRFTLPANGVISLEVQLNVTQTSAKPNDYGLVHAVFDDGREAMPQLLRWPAK